VSNNASVGKAFTKHIKPRSDLLFAGENLQHRSDNIARQWLTRVYYLAHSPFRITWALDSNVVSCSPGQAQRMLDAALATNLWGYNIAHASQNLLSSIMYPHNFNIIYTWDMVASDLFREWFLTAVSEGVASDDQKSLHIAELRLRAQLTAAGRDLYVGRVAPEYGAAFYDVMNRGNKTHAPTRRADRIRITPVLNGAVHLLHGTNASLCATFNQNLGVRQLLVKPKGREQKGRARQLIYTIVTDGPACAKLLGDDARYCLLRGPSGTPSSITLQDYILPSQLEDLHAYAHSRRCGEACEGVLLEETRDDSASRAGALSKAQAGEQRWPQEFHTPCADISGKRLQYFDRFEPRCPDGKVMQRFALTSIGCRSGTFRVSFVCVDVHTNRLLGAPLPDIFLKASECAPVRGEALHELQAHPFSCGPRYGLQGWRLSSEGCSRKRHMRFHYDCVHLGYEEVPREDTISDSSSCSDAIRAPVNALAMHAVACPLTHALATVRFTSKGCDLPSQHDSHDGGPASTEGGSAWHTTHWGQYLLGAYKYMHFSYLCVLLMDGQRRNNTAASNRTHSMR